MGTIDAMTMTNGESVIDTAPAMAITVHVGTKDMDGAAVRMTTSKVTTNNEPPGVNAWGRGTEAPRSARDQRSCSS